MACLEIREYELTSRRRNVFRIAEDRIAPLDAQRRLNRAGGDASILPMLYGVR
ncbi:MAG: hypothetical protein OJF48_000530 [Afipia sp.]|nr:MAG: hypothetical protein OJF48_000530 [Afipia sp.]